MFQGPSELPESPGELAKFLARRRLEIVKAAGVDKPEKMSDAQFVKFFERFKNTNDTIAATRKQVEAVKSAAKRRERDEAQKLQGLTTIPSDPGVVGVEPRLDLHCPGTIAIRQWTPSSTGFLKSTAAKYTWHVINVSDETPTPTNSRGFHAHRVTPETLFQMHSTVTYGGAETIRGLIELRGHIVEHTDNVVRASWARVMCLFVSAYVDMQAVQEMAEILKRGDEPLYYQPLTDEAGAYHLTLAKLKKTYDVPMLPVNMNQLSAFLFKVAIRNATLKASEGVE